MGEGATRLQMSGSRGGGGGAKPLTPTMLIQNSRSASGGLRQQQKKGQAPVVIYGIDQWIHAVDDVLQQPSPRGAGALTHCPLVVTSAQTSPTVSPPPD